MLHITTFSRFLVCAAIALLSFPAFAVPPKLQTPEPVIYLADNLDEEDRLGWCIDTLGRGFSEQLQVHSCKPQGGDVQFYFDQESGVIASAEFTGKCATLVDAANENIPFGLLDCEIENRSQVFAYDASSMEFRVQSDEALCLAAGAESRKAGPFMSRDLQLKACADVPSKLRQWIIKGGKPAAN